MKVKVLVLALLLTPSIASATFVDCREAGGSWLGCFYEAAMNDQIAFPDGGNCSGSAEACRESQIKESFHRNKAACKSVPVEKQVACLSRPAPKKAVAKPMKPIAEKPVAPKSVKEKAKDINIKE